MKRLNNGISNSWKNWKTCLLVTSFVLLLVMISGCVNYKMTSPANSNAAAGDADLVNKIAQVEQELSAQPASKAAEETKAVEEKKAAEETNAEEKPAANEPTPASATDVNSATNVKNDAKKADENTEKTAEKTAVEKAEDKTEDGTQIVRVKENEKVRLAAEIKDPDNDTINYTFTKQLNERGEWKTDYSDAGEYVITLSATDGKLSTSKKIKLIVERVNVPPVMTGLRDITVNEGETVTFTPKVEDPNKDAVTVAVTEPLKTGTFKTDHTSAGEYQIKVSASDGERTTEKSFKLTVRDVNVPPEIKNVEETITVKEGEVVALKPVIMDLDNDDVKVTVSNPVGNDNVWQTSFTDHGEYAVTITADDGKTKVNKKIKVVVTDVNMPPEIVKISLQRS